MKMLIKEKLSPHKSKTPEGYLICYDAILARTGKQDYYASELWENVIEDRLVSVDRKPEQVFSPEALASFENKPLTLEHPYENVNPENYKNYSVGFVRDVRQGESDNQQVMLANIVVTDAQVIDEIEQGIRTELSCGYDCDITDEPNPEQINIRGNHVALCTQGRAGIAKIVDHNLIKDELLPAVPAEIRRKINNVLSRYNGKSTDVHVYDIINELTKFGILTTREKVIGWTEAYTGEYYKDYIYSINGYSNPLFIRLYAEAPSWKTKEVNAYLGTERINFNDSKGDDIGMVNDYIEYRGYYIDYNFYNNNEYSVEYMGDDVIFETADEAKKFIDEIIEKAESMMRDHAIRNKKKKINIKLKDKDLVIAKYNRPEMEDDCEIIRASNGKYFINYYVDNSITSVAGPFKTREEAEQALLKHRPGSKKLTDKIPMRYPNDLEKEVAYENALDYLYYGESKQDWIARGHNAGLPKDVSDEIWAEAKKYMSSYRDSKPIKDDRFYGIARFNNVHTTFEIDNLDGYDIKGEVTVNFNSIMNGEAYPENGFEPGSSDIYTYGDPEDIEIEDLYITHLYYSGKEVVDESTYDEMVYRLYENFNLIIEYIDYDPLEMAINNGDYDDYDIEDWERDYSEDQYQDSKPIKDFETEEYSTHFHKDLTKFLVKKKKELEKDDETKKDDETTKQYNRQKGNLLSTIKSQLNFLKKKIGEDDK